MDHHEIAITVNRSIGFLHPKLQETIPALLQDLEIAHKAGRTQFPFKLFEGFRHPLRQEHLLTMGTTKARMWQSAHQYGLAVDLVPVNRKGWTWDVDEADWETMRRLARQHGLLTPIAWDKPHVEHPLWERIKRHVV